MRKDPDDSEQNTNERHLMARFANPKIAADAEAELEAFLDEHEELANESIQYHGGDPLAPTEACHKLGAKYGFAWKDGLTWNDMGDEPNVFVAGDTLIIWYCDAWGSERELTAYLQARGARVHPGDGSALPGPPAVSVLFSLPKNAKKARALKEELANAFAFGRAGARATKKLPWYARYELDEWIEEATAFFCDGTMIGFYLRTDPQDIERLRQYLSRHGIDAPTIRLCEHGDRAKFQAVARARCDACGGSLSYVDPNVHALESEQLACAGCGAMFELSNFLTLRS